MSVQEDVQFKITDEQRQAFNDDGVTVLRGVINGQWLARLDESIEN